MANIEKARKEEIKEGEKILKSIIGGQMVRNRQFYRKMAINGIRNTPKAWHKINSQIKDELKSGELHPNGVQKRVDELVLEISGNNVLLTEQSHEITKTEQLKQRILDKGKVAIQIPYRASGVGGTVRGGTLAGGTGAFLGSFEEGDIKWKVTDLLFIDGGVSVKSTGQVVLYENIKKIVTGEKGMLFTVVTIVTDNGENIVYKTGNDNAIASKTIIEENIPSKVVQIPQARNVTPDKPHDADELLLKYAELYEKGLLTKEEFDMKKAELLGTNNKKETQEEKQSLKESIAHDDEKPKFCGSCGSPIVSDANFCTNCGAKLH